jgi:hypothetical protein
MYLGKPSTANPLEIFDLKAPKVQYSGKENRRRWRVVTKLNNAAA